MEAPFGIELTLLGTVEARRSDGTDIPSIPRSPKRLALLSYLAARGSFQRRDVLLALLWPEFDESRARGALRSLLSLLRKDLGEGVLLTRGQEEVGLNEERIRCDIRAFKEAVALGDHRRARESYGGELLRGFHLANAPGFQDWLDMERRRLRDQAIASAVALAEEAEARGHATEAVGAARWAAELAPWNEAVATRLIRLLGESGNGAAATRVYRRLEAHLDRELDMTPGVPVKKALQQATRDRESPSARGTESRGAEKPEPRTDLPPEAASPTPGPGTPRRARRWKALAAIFGMLLVTGSLVGAWAVARPGSSVPERSAGTPVRIVPFSVRGSGDLAYLSQGMVDLLTAKLDIPGVVRPIDGRVADPTPTPFTVEGTLVTAGAGVHLSARWMEEGGAVLGSASVDVDQAELLTGVDSLVRMLLADRYDTPAESLRRAAATTTGSLPALRSFVAAEHLYRIGRFGEAAEGFRSAVALDPTFALAHLRLGQTYEWLDQPRKAEAAFTAAQERRDRLPPRSRYVLDARQAYWDRRQLEALHAYDELLARYPDDVEGLYGRGDFVFHEGPGLGRPLTRARPDFERLLELDPGNREALLHLTRIAATEGRVSEVRRLVRPLEQGTGLVAAEARALALLAGGPPSERQIQELGNLQAMEGLNRVTTVVRAVEAWGGIQGSLELASLLHDATLPTSRATGHVLQALVLASRGQMRRAEEALPRAGHEVPQMAWTTRAVLALNPVVPWSRERLEALLASAPEFPEELYRLEAHPVVTHSFRPPTGEYLNALLLARLGRSEDLARALERMSRDLGEPGSAVRTARAWATLIDGNATEASRLVTEQRGPLETRVRFWGLGAFLNGEILKEAGAFDEALDWYESVTLDLRFDTFYRTLSYFRRAQVLEELGRTDEAARMYRRFLEAWSDPDPGAERPVTEARAALHRLGDADPRPMEISGP